MSNSLGRSLAVLLVAFSLACGSSSETAPATPPPSTPTVATAPAALPGASGDVLLDTDGTLAGDGMRSEWSIPVTPGRVRVSLSSSAFDPVLGVVPPEAERMTNDDVAGDRTRSELIVDVASAGELKVDVTGFAPGASGAYHVRAERIAVTEPTAVATAPATAPAAPPGATPPAAGATGTAPALPGLPSLPAGTPPVVAGAVGAAAAAAAGALSGVFGAAREHHSLPSGFRGYLAGAVPASAGAGTPPAAVAVRLGDRLEASLGSGDASLATGELADYYVLSATPGSSYTVQMASTAVDSFLMITGPNGESLTNDDSGGSLDSEVVITPTSAGDWTIVATTYSPGMSGAYELKVLPPTRPSVAVPGAAPATGTDRTEHGALAAGDSTLTSGEFFDEYDFDWPAGTAIHLEANSTTFDTYLILRTPSGRQTDNDDRRPGDLNAAIDFVVTEPGPHRVLVTSYAPGMSGSYDLLVRGGSGAPATMPPSTGTPLPPPAVPTALPPVAAGPPGAARTENGELAAGDATLTSGELMDTYDMTFAAGSPVTIHVESSAFDTYLIVRSPSGRQTDNDDIRPGILNSEVSIASAEAGSYSVIVTSYAPGMTGRYVLTAGASAGGAVATTPPGGSSGGGPVAMPTSGTRVWTVSVGISDYPGSANDLPECANDAVKIAEALRNQSLTTTDTEILLTDSNATLGNVRQALQRVAAGIGPGDTFIFFYSGHGGQTTAARRDDPNELDGLDEYIVLFDGNLVDDELGRLVDQIHARTALVALDSCFAGGFAKDVVDHDDIFGMFSSEEDTTSAVASEFSAGGYLSHFLRMGISGEGDSDPRDSRLTVGELTHYVRLQWSAHAADVRMGDGYQELVVERGAVSNDALMW